MSSSTKANAAKVATMMDAQKGKHVGSIVMWNFISPSVASADLKALFVKHGLDWGQWGPADLDGEVTFHKAISEAKRTVKGWRFVTLLESKEKKVIGVVEESVDKVKEDVKYRTDWTTDAVKLTFDKVNSAVKTTNRNHPVSKVVLDTFAKLADLYTTPDFTRLLTRNMLNSGAFKLRPMGGDYFVPATSYDVVLKHKAMIEECGTEFNCFNVKEDEVSRQDLGRSAMRSMGEELQSLNEELQRWESSPPRADTLGRRIEEYKALKNKAEMYASMLSIKADDLLLGVAACTKKARAILGIVEGEKAAKTTPATKTTKTKPTEAKVVVKTSSDRKPIKQAMKEIAAKHKDEEKAAKKATSKVKITPRSK